MGAFAAVAFRSRPPDSEVVTRMLAAAPHRGASAEVVSCGDAVLGVSGSVELENAWLGRDNGVAAAFVGNLDNRAELAAELGAPRDHGHDDPAKLVIAAYRRWGEGFPARLRGSFSGAVVDENELVAFRDQLGFETLFYRDEETAFLAATEAKQVVAGAGIPRRPELDALPGIFYGRLQPDQTALEGVYRFPMASTARVGAGRRASFHRYWDPRALLETARVSDDEARERLVKLLERAVARTVTGNDGISLSGGVDSPAVAAFAVSPHMRLAGRPPLAVSAVYPDLPNVNELSHIEAVADLLGLPLHTYVPHARPLDDVAYWVDVLDGPVDVLSVPEVAESYRVARAAGVSTVLTGELAEYVYAIRQHLPGHLLLHGRWRAFARWVDQERSRGSSWRRIARTLAPSVTPSLLATAYVRLLKRDNRPLPVWVDPAQVGGLGNRLDLRRPARRRWSESQLDSFGGGASISVEADALCAALCGVRVRRPLADIDLWEFFLSLPAERKFPDSAPKSLVRQVLRGRIPDTVLDRRDQTVFDDHYLAAADYPALRRWILDSEYRLEGVDYKVLAERLNREEMDVHELSWANDLARIHAFVSLWA
ncbi:MAG: asparagine synthase-related protein [Gaiellales bacterium]